MRMVVFICTLISSPFKCHLEQGGNKVQDCQIVTLTDPSNFASPCEDSLLTDCHPVLKYSDR